jgi:hypothetical protein
MNKQIQTNCCYNDLRVSFCLKKYVAKWAGLQRLTGTTCDAPRFVDNGNNTVTDNLTGLVWEKKTDDGSVHDWDNLYTWTASDGDLTDEDGTAFTTFLSTLNTDGFAGANDWRLPTLAELQTILLPEPAYGCTDPCIDPVFGPYTHGYRYWTATTFTGSPYLAWHSSFSEFNYVYAVYKDHNNYVRAVRGGF